MQTGIVCTVLSEMEIRMEQLAIFGGEPVRKTPISYGHQYIDDADIEAVANVLRSDALTCGPKVTELEKRLCEVTGANYVVMVSNGTAALHLAAMAAGITKGDERFPGGTGRRILQQTAGKTRNNLLSVLYRNPGRNTSGTELGCRTDQESRRNDRP